MLIAPKFLLKQEEGIQGVRVIDIFWIYALVFLPIGLFLITHIYKYNVKTHSLMNVTATEKE
jgi:hypothetical protein